MGGRLRALRATKEISQAELCKLTGLWQNVYSRYENDKVKYVDVTMIDKLAFFLNTTREYILCQEVAQEHFPQEMKDFLDDPKSFPFVLDAFLLFKKSEMKYEVNDDK
jgi:transcriptional regulator with XRE-family HTH domain